MYLQYNIWMSSREKRPSGHVWADSSSCCSVITLGGGIQNPRGDRQMAQFQIVVFLYLGYVWHLWCVGCGVSTQIRCQTWECAHQLVFVNMTTSLSTQECVIRCTGLSRKEGLELLTLLQTYTDLKNIFALALACDSEVKSWSELICQMLLTVSAFASCYLHKGALFLRAVFFLSSGMSKDVTCCVTPSFYCGWLGGSKVNTGKGE